MEGCISPHFIITLKRPDLMLAALRVKVQSGFPPGLLLMPTSPPAHFSQLLMKVEIRRRLYASLFAADGELLFYQFFYHEIHMRIVIIDRAWVDQMSLHSERIG